MEDIEQWNKRARWCCEAIECQGSGSLVDRAHACLDRWKSLKANLRGVSRELRAAAHQGLYEGPVSEIVVQHREGCLTLCSMVGGGKTTAAAWMAYRTVGPVLWLDAVRIAIARTGAIDRWLNDVQGASFVMVDDVGAAGTVGQYESPRVAAVLTAVAARTKPSIVSTNLDRDAFGRAYDAGSGGRLIDRLTMRPNRWIDLADEPESRRVAAEPPPDEDELPKRERRAAEFLRAVAATRRARSASVMEEVDTQAIRLVADRLGQATIADLDRAVERAEIDRAALEEELNKEYPWFRPAPAGGAPAAEPQGVEQRSRVALLDLLANAAERHACEEADILAQIGRTRRTLGPEDESALLALLG